MRKPWPALILVPAIAHAGFELNYDLKGPIAGFTERDGKCYVAIDAQDHRQYRLAYHHVDDSKVCDVARTAYRLNESVVAKAFFYSAGNRGSATHGIKAIEMTRDGKAYWPPYGGSK